MSGKQLTLDGNAVQSPAIRSRDHLHRSRSAASSSSPHELHPDKDREAYCEECGRRLDTNILLNSREDIQDAGLTDLEGEE